MKKKLSIAILMLFMIPNIVLAAGKASGSAPTSVENGSRVTFSVNISNTAAWNIKLSGSGATSGCSQKFADVTANGKNTTKKLSITCKATSIGTITFKATGDITSADGTNSNVSITKTVNVVKPREKEKEARLSKLSVEGYNINFNKDKETYSISVPPTVNSIKIFASAISSRATVSGTGTKELDADGGKFIITCTAENGTKKKYTINVSIIDKNPINVKINNEDYTIVKSSKQLKAPSNTISGKTTINEMEVPSFTNKNTKITIVGIKDKDGEIKYATYDNGDYKLYNENKSTELLLYITEKKLEGYEETTITINENDYIAYKINDRFVVVYATDLKNGESNYYKYDKTSNTFQYFDVSDEGENIETSQKEKKEVNIYLITTIIFGIISLGSVCYIIRSKKTKKSKKNKQ